ncbi:progestin and adipoQ receptor family member 3-like isoform 2-T5 [Salvelinus alpinus]
MRSHLLWFLLFFLLGVNDMSTVLPASGANKDYVIYCIGRFCFQVCMLCSVGYHLFSCHLSEKKCCHWTTLEPWLLRSRGLFWRQVCLVIVIALILAVFLAQIHLHYHSKEWRHQRTAILGSVAVHGVIPAVHGVIPAVHGVIPAVHGVIPAVHGVIPAVHWIWLNGSFSSAVVQMSHQIPELQYWLFLPRDGDVLDSWSRVPLLRRPAELPGCQSPGVTCPGGVYALLVAPDFCVFNELQAQPALLPYLHQQQLEPQTGPANNRAATDSTVATQCKPDDN